METVRRYDSVEIRQDARRRDARGFLRVPANLTRSGVLEYMRSDGSKVREYRPAEEVFKADSLASLRGAPVTDLHPRERVTPSNVASLRVGGVGDDVHRDGIYVAADLAIEREGSIKAVERGDRAELSCGYSCRVDATPGVTSDGERYDAVQRDIVYNHVALGPRGWGRAGRDVALRADGSETDSWRLDAGDAVLITDAGTEPPTATPAVRSRADGGVMPTKIRLDGETIELATDESAGKLEAVLKSRSDALEAITKERDEAKSARAKAEARADNLQEKLDAAQKPEAIAAAVKQRLDLERGASLVLGSSEKLDSLTDAEIRAKAIEKARPSLKLDGKGAEYIEAMFDLVVADAGQRNDSVRVPPGSPRESRGDENEGGADAVIAKLRSRHDAWMKETA